MAILRKSLLLSALVLTILGTGNIIFGSSRLGEYYSNLTERHTTLDADSEARLLARIDYYKLVVYGGKWMLAIAALCFASTLGVHGKSDYRPKN